MQAGLSHESLGEVCCLDLRTVTFGTQPFDLGLLGFDQVGSLKPNAKH
jgi:hypothetical protein